MGRRGLSSRLRSAPERLLRACARLVFGPWSTVVSPIATNASTGRFPDGADTGSNCADFLTQAAAALAASSSADASNIKVASVEGFGRGPDDPD